MPLTVNSDMYWQPTEEISYLCFILLKYLITSCGCHWDTKNVLMEEMSMWFFLKEIGWSKLACTPCKAIRFYSHDYVSHKNLSLVTQIKKNISPWQWFLFDAPIRPMQTGKCQRAETVLLTGISIVSNAAGLFSNQGTWGFVYKLLEP